MQTPEKGTQFGDALVVHSLLFASIDRNCTIHHSPENDFQTNGMGCVNCVIAGRAGFPVWRRQQQQQQHQRVWMWIFSAGGFWSAGLDVDFLDFRGCRVGGFGCGFSWSPAVISRIFRKRIRDFSCTTQIWMGIFSCTTQIWMGIFSCTTHILIGISVVPHKF